MILVDLAIPAGVRREEVAAIVERWGQTVRHALAGGDVPVGAARGVVLPIPVDHVLAGLDLAATVLAGERRAAEPAHAESDDAR